MSIKEIKLTKPLLVNGKSINVLTYDIDELTIEDITRAEALKKKLGISVSTSMAQTDFPLHICIGIRAIMAINKEISEEDLLRLKGYDISQLGVAGIGFFVPQAQLEGNNLEELQEDTLNDTTAQFKAFVATE